MRPILLLGAALLWHDAAAQLRPDTTRDSLRTARLPAIVVSASRSDVTLKDNPAATMVVGAPQLEAMPRGIAVDEALLLVPGVKVDNQADGKRVHLSIRGQGILSERGIRGTKVLLDGLPLNDPSGFASDLFDVDWPTVRGIQVQRGPEASLFGGGSSAGVMSIATADGGGAPAAGELSSQAGSNGFWRATGQMGGTAGGLNYRASYTHNEGDGWRVHTRFRGDNVYAKTHWSPGSGWELTPIVWYTRFYNQNAEGLNRAQVDSNPRMANPDANKFNEYQDTHRVMGGLVGRAELGGGGATLAFDAFARHTAYDEAVPSSVVHRKMLSPGATLQLTVPAATGALRHHIGVGTDLQLQDIDETAYPNLGLAVEGPTLLSDQTMRQDGVGVFALDQVDLGERWSLMLNARWDRVGNRVTDRLKPGGLDRSGSASFAAVTGRVGATYAPSDALAIYGNVGQGFLPPATEELFANPAAVGGFNADLTAAVSWGQEIGVRGAGAALQYDVALFHLTTDRDFDRYRVASRPLETFYRNAGSSRRWGVEAALSWAPAAPLLLQLAYTWNDFRYTNDSSAYGAVRGHWLPNSPEHKLAADVAWALTPALTLGASADALSHWYVDASNAASVDGYTLLHARAAWRLSAGVMPVALTVAVRNVFGVKYIAFTEPDPDGNSYQPAAEREIFVGLTLQR